MSSTASRWASRLGWMLTGAIVTTTLTVAASGPRSDTIYRKLEVLAEVLGHIENQYVDPVEPTDLVYGAARGTVDSLDTHSTFFDPDEYSALVDSTEGEYAGIGVELDLQSELPQVVAVLDGSPAQRAGIQRGDIIIAVDGKSLSGIDLDRISRLIRGPVGTKLTLQIKRATRQRLWSFTLVRSWVRVAPIEHRALGDDLHYVHIKMFPRRVAGEVDGLLQRVGPIRGLVLDLRNNPGGLLDEAVELCDLFLAGGPIVAVIGRGGRLLEQRNARPAARQSAYPVAILIDVGSASAAEIVAGALRDRGRARLFGRKTYGKGSVQSIIDLSDGSGLKLTVARYITPSGRQIDGFGINPDELIERAPESDDDLDLSEAVKWLREKS